MPQGASILGNLNIDLILGPMSAPPPFGHELVVPLMTTRAAGAAGNTAAALDRLGVASLICGTVGHDAWQKLIFDEFRRYPLVDLSHIETCATASTGLSVALVSQSGERGFVSYAGALALADEALLARHEAALLACPYLIICGYFFMPALRGRPMAALLKRARRAGVQVLLDTGWDLDDWPEATCREVLALLPDVDVFLPNLDEARALTGCDSAEACASALLEHGAHAVGLKLGPDGSLWSDAQALIHQPARRVAALDTTGAGDCFDAAVVYGLAQGWPVAKTLAFANAFCGMVISRLDDRIPSAAAVMSALRW